MTGQLRAEVKKIKTTGDAAVKDEYRPETDNVRSALSSLETTVKQLADPSQRTTAVQQLPANVDNVKTATGALSDATKSKCR